MDLRTCNHCGNQLPFDAHYLRKFCDNTCKEQDRYERTGSGRISNKARRESYKRRMNNPEQHQKITDGERKRYQQIQSFLSRYKLWMGCIDCGYKKHSSALDFDHVRGTKKKNVCASKSIAQAKEEIRKCDIVCANCHRIRTYNRLQNK